MQALKDSSFNNNLDYTQVNMNILQCRVITPTTNTIVTTSTATIMTTTMIPTSTHSQEANKTEHGSRSLSRQRKSESPKLGFRKIHQECTKTKLDPSFVGKSEKYINTLNTSSIRSKETH